MLTSLIIYIYLRKVAKADLSEFKGFQSKDRSSGMKMFSNCMEPYIILHLRALHGLDGRGLTCNMEGLKI